MNIVIIKRAIQCKLYRIKLWVCWTFFADVIYEERNRLLLKTIKVKCGNPCQSKRKRLVRRAYKLTECRQ